MLCVSESLAVLLSSDRGPTDIFKTLLQLVVAPDDQFRSKFKGRGLKWEALAVDYLGDEVASGDSSSDQPRYRLSLIEELIDQTLTKVCGCMCTLYTA